MNLVQLQERLKDIPMPSLMEYANGQNPAVPPYLALAELKRRESMTQAAQSQQAMAQGRQPSVKEQVEQAAGLATLQKQAQAQGLRSLMAQARPAAVPENVPQPERQPEAEGVAGLPTGDMYNFADGGIVAFAGGGDTELKSNEQLQKEYDDARYSGDFREASRIFKLLKMREAEAPRTVKTPVAPLDDTRASAGVASLPPQPDMGGVPAGAMPPPARLPAGALPAPGGVPTSDLAMPRRSAGAMPFGAPDSTQPSIGIAGIPGATESQELLLKKLREVPTAESAREAEQKMSGLYGLTDQAGQDRMKRYQEMQAARAADLKERDTERLMRVLGGIATGGLGGAGPAYLQAREGERISDQRFRERMDELMGGVEEKRRAEQVAGMQRAQKGMETAESLRLGIGEKLFDAEQRRKNDEAKLRLEHQLRMMQPTEATILLKVMDDIRRRNPEKSEAEIYAMAREAQQGATPELKRQQERRQYAAQWAKIQGDMLQANEQKAKGILTFNDYLKSVGAGDLAEPIAIPPIPAGAVRLKGAQ